MRTAHGSTSSGSMAPVMSAAYFAAQHKSGNGIMALKGFFRTAFERIVEARERQARAYIRQMVATQANAPSRGL